MTLEARTQILQMMREENKQSDGIGEQFGTQKPTSRVGSFSMQVICISNGALIKWLMIQYSQIKVYFAFPATPSHNLDRPSQKLSNRNSSCSLTIGSYLYK